MNTTKDLKTRIVTWLATLVLIASLVIMPADGAWAESGGSLASYIVEAATTFQASSAVETCGGAVTSQLEIINSVGANLETTQVACVKGQPGVVSVFANEAVQITGDIPGDKPADGLADKFGGKDRNPHQAFRSNPSTDYPEVTGANLVWDKGHNTGRNVTVAVVDTGIELLNGMSNTRVRGWMDFVEGKKWPVDPNGHGTHVAGVIANHDSGSDKEYNGIAPGADLVVVRVLKEDGSGTYENVIKGIQWAVQNKDRYNIRVMNLSLVSPAQAPYWVDPLNRAVTAAWANGITVVVAAGNTGSKPMTISAPGNNPYAITVGAFTDNFTPLKFYDDYVTPFSSAGPTLDGFAKPDLVAPGAHMVSLMSPRSYVARNHRANQVGNNYFEMAGTSQAAAVVSGVSALVISAHPRITPNQVKYRLTTSALPWMSLEQPKAVYSIWQQGFGRVNAPDAVYGNLNGEANPGMDIQADLAGKTHYEGYSYYDSETGMFRLRGPYANLTSSFWTWDGSYAPGTGAIGAWSGAIGAWSGAIGAWSGAIGAWSGAIGAWSGAIGAWSGAIGAWSGAIGAWSGAIGAWSGAIGAWSGGYTSWAGGAQAWTGSEPWAELGLSQPAAVNNFKSAKQVSTAMTVSTCQWVDEP